MIDFHTHTPAWRTSTWISGVAFGADDFVSFMDGVGTERAVVLSHDGLFDPSPEANDDLAAFVATHPARLVGLGSVQVRRPGAAAEVERMRTELGLAGVKVHPWLHGVSMHEPVMDEVCEAAYGGILLCHDGSPPYSTPAQIAALARRHPRLPVVLGHGGLHDLWREALAVTQETANLHLCLCGTPPYAARKILAEAPATRVLFGTDAGLSDKTSQDYAVARVAEVDGWGITAAQRKAMLEDNPRRLLERVA